MANKEYTLGLDIGTNSVGWAVIDENNNLVKKRRHYLWGVRLFDGADIAKDRRKYRNARRRYKRRKERIRLLQSIFKNEITKVDKDFYTRLDESFFLPEDSTIKDKTLLVNLFTNKEYYEKYPTIYHLRKALIEKDEKFDIRLVYLAIHHIIKYRGNFLVEGDFNSSYSQKLLLSVVASFEEKMIEAMSYFQEVEETNDYDIILESKNLAENQEFLSKYESIILKDSYNGKENKSRNDKKRNLKELFIKYVGKNSIYQEFFGDFMITGKRSLQNLLLTKDNKHDKYEIDLNSKEYQDLLDKARPLFPEISSFLDIIDGIKSLKDTYYVTKLLGPKKSTISEALVQKYNEHKEDLHKLKLFIKKYLPNEYNEIFREKRKDNYCAYIGLISTSKVGKINTKHASEETFYGYIKKKLSKINKKILLPEDKKFFDDILIKIKNEIYLPKMKSASNGAIPHQLHLIELKRILEQQAKYYDFLSDNNFENVNKIISIFKFKRPYYVGPLKGTEESKYSWAKLNKSNEKAFPWNFNEIVNLDESAEEFIRRMQNKCTYLKGKEDYCVPKASIYFQAFNVFSYLNKLRINGSLINQEAKELIFNEIFLKVSKPTKKNIEDLLYSNDGSNIKELNIPVCNVKMSSYLNFVNVYGSNKEVENNIDEIEEIIEEITLFEDKDVLIKRLKERHHLDENKIKKIKSFNYSGYGRICKKLLIGLEIKDYNGEIHYGILPIMKNTNLNLQEILFSDEYNLNQIIDQYNKENIDKDHMDGSRTELERFLDENITISPLWRRAFNQSYKIIEELEEILKAPITYYSIECTRTNKAEKKKESKTRYNRLKELYNASVEFKNEILKYGINFNDIDKKLDNNEIGASFSDKIYLYFEQLGKDLYSPNLDTIDLNDLIHNTNKYEIDHIYPQSLIKDDSLSNRVLVHHNYNQKKKEQLIFEIPGFISEKQREFFRFLKDNNLMSDKKYKRLTERGIENAELEGFVNRQKVATDQAVKALIQTLKLFKNVPSTNIFYSKAENISDFRHTYGIYKSREANNYHHAHDAYLNAFLGKVLETYYRDRGQFTFKDFKANKENDDDNKYSINPKKILSGYKRYYIKKDGIIWNGWDDINKIKDNIFNNYDIRETFRTFTGNGMFSKVSILPKGEGNLKIKNLTPNGNEFDVSKYGRINSASYSKYVIIKRFKNEKEEYQLIPLPRTEVERPRMMSHIATLLKCEDTDFEVINDDIRTNVVIKKDKRQFNITGVSGSSFLIKNTIDRNFDKKSLLIIRNITKFNELKNYETRFKVQESKILCVTDKEKLNEKNTSYECYLLIHAAKQKDFNNQISSKKIDLLHADSKNNIDEDRLKDKDVFLTIEDLNYIYEKLRNLYSKDINSYSNITSIYKSMPNSLFDHFKNLNNCKLIIENMIEVIFNLLQLLKTNERKVVDLTKIGLSKNSGKLSISQTLETGTKFISYSVTGLNEKTLFEVK